MTELFLDNNGVSKPSVCKQSQCNIVKKVIDPKVKDLGGFKVRRVLPVPEHRSVGPWIFFDHMGPASFDKGEGINVRPHPHINLATVTYTFEGEIWHRDSLGNSAPILPGEVNLMVAGKGITHSERTRKELLDSGQKLNGLQLWMALPEDDEEIAPNFYHYDREEIPRITHNGVEISVIIGEAYGKNSPVKVFMKTLYVEFKAKKGQRISIPEVAECGIYVESGSLRVGKEDIDTYSFAILNSDIKAEVQVLDDAHFVLIGGDRISKRYMEWNFVSSRKERIEQAKKDWSHGSFDKVYEDEEEFIPYP